MDPDLILLNSTCIKNSSPIKIPGYLCYQKNTLENQSDGSAIAIKITIQHKILHNFTTDLIALQIETTTGPIVISTMYQPPSRDFLPTNDFTTLFRRNCPVYMISDLNANHRTIGYNQNNVKGNQINRMIHNRLIQHIGPNFATFYHARGATTPDIILTNYRTYHNTYCVQGPITTSDHIPIIFTISSSPILIPTPSKKNINKTNWGKLREEIDNTINIPNLHNKEIEDIDKEIEEWYNKIKTAMDKYIPTTCYKQLPAPQLSHTTKTLIITFNNLKQHAHTQGWTLQHFRHYKILQKRLQDHLIQEHNRNWHNLITKTINTYKDPQQFWKKIKIICGETEPQPKYILNEYNNKIYQVEEQEAIHRQIWQNVFGEEEIDSGDEEEENNQQHIYNYLNNNLHRITPTQCIDLNNLNNNIMDQEITTEEIIQTIKKSKNTAPGHSTINKTILSNLPPKAIDSLRNIYNASISAGYFPDIWKKSIIKLIPKSGKDPHLPQNYRPISLLEVPGKMLERILNNRLKNHLEYHSKHYHNQFGFRTNRSTNQALAIATETIAQNLSDNGQCQVILRDISKAFDKVWHIGLKYKILQLELPTNIERILCDFLDDRTAQIKIKEHIGREIDIKTGVPQGSVLAPTLFTIFTRDIPPPRQGTNIIYADDITQITGYPGKSRNIINMITQREINNINEYEKTWKIKTNVEKFTPIQLSVRTTVPLNIQGNNIEFKKEGNSLGLKITTNGYCKHIKERTTKAKYSLSKLYRLHTLPQKIKIHLIKSLILPILHYPPIPLHAQSNTQILKLQRVQNAALRFATNERYPYTLNTEEIHLLTNTKTINTYLHEQATKTWSTLQQMQHPSYLQLQRNKRNIIRYHKNFPSSLGKLEENVNPIYT